MLARGIRNHNPLNVRRSKDQWKGMAEVQTDRALDGAGHRHGYSREWGRESGLLRHAKGLGFVQARRAIR